jgi:hypothetical protein
MMHEDMQGCATWGGKLHLYLDVQKHLIKVDGARERKVRGRYSDGMRE